MLPAATGFGLAELVTLKSAWVVPATPMVTVAELSLLLVSVVGVATVAVSVMMVFAGVPAATLTMTGNVLVEVGAKVGSEQLMVPVPPTAGRLQVHPEGTGLSEKNVVLVGITSVNVAVEQLLGPPSVTTCV